MPAGGRIRNRRFSSTTGMIFRYWAQNSGFEFRRRTPGCRLLTPGWSKSDWLREADKIRSMLNAKCNSLVFAGEISYFFLSFFYGVCVFPHNGLCAQVLRQQPG